MTSEPVLQTSRIAAWAINALTDQLGMGSFVHKFIGDDEQAWSVAPGGVTALVQDHAAVTCIISNIEQAPITIEVVINNIWTIVRPRYIAEFNPLQYGVVPQTQVNWMGDTPNDIQATVRLEDPESQIVGLNAPRNHLPQHRYGKRKPACTGSLDRNLPRY